MKIVRNKGTFVVNYIFSDSVTVDLTDSSMVAGQTVDTKINVSTHEVVENVEIPDLFVANAMTYVGTTWAIIDVNKFDEIFNAHKEKRIEMVKNNFIKVSENPRVDTGLGYFVDGSYISLTNFQIAAELGLPQIRDADNKFHSVTETDLQTIINAIKLHGVQLYQKKWQMEEAITAASSYQELNNVNIEF